MSELTKVMLERGDYDFINLLNKIREERIDQDIKFTLNSRFLMKIHALNMLCIYLQKISQSKGTIRLTQLGLLESQLICIDAIDEVPKDIILSGSQINAIKQWKISESGNLASQLKIKIGAQVTLISNLDIEERLLDGQVGTVTQFKYINNKLSLVYVKFNNDSEELVACS